MPIRHAIRGQLTPRGVTPRRLAAANRALQRQRDRLPLFADQVAAEQGTPAERIEQFDRDQLEHDQARRDLASQHWRWGRSQLSQLTADVRTEILERWNNSSIPPTSAYFADFVRRQLRDHGLPIKDDA